MRNEFKIKFTGLKTGIHSFSFEIGDSFFKSFEYSQIEEADVKALVELEKMNNMMVANFHLTGELGGLCDRCQDPLKIPIDYEERLVIKYGEETGSTDDEVMVLGPAEYEIILDQYFYEYIHLALPKRNVHESIEDCNQDIVNRLYEGEDEIEEPNDPRWDQLRNLID